eukprot:scaffold3.g6703.t1
MAQAFGLFFVGLTPPLAPGAGIVQTDPTHWVLDVASLAGGSWAAAYRELKEVALFLTAPNALPPDAALALYVSTTGGSSWGFRGCITNAHPSEVLPLSFPAPEEGAPLAPQIGISLEPLAEAQQKQGMKLAAKSFGGGAPAVAGLLDSWFQRLSNRLRKDPDFLTRTQLDV